MLFSFLLISLAVNILVQAQLIPDSRWTESNITISRQERIDIAAQALDTTIAMLDSNMLFGSQNGSKTSLSDTARLFAQLAAFDGLSNQTKYMDRVRKYFDLRGTRGGGNLTAASTETSSANYVLLYGTAAQQAIKYYGKGSVLEDIPSGIEFFLQSRTAKSASGGKPIGTPSFSNGCFEVFRNNSQMDAILGDSNWASEPGPDGQILLANSSSVSIEFYTNTFSAQQYYDTFKPLFAERTQGIANVLEDPFSSFDTKSLSSDDCGARISLGEGVAKPIYLDGNTTLSAAKNSFDETALREQIVDAINVLDTWHAAGDKDELKDGSGKPVFNIAPLNMGELLFSLYTAHQNLGAYSDMQAYIGAYISSRYNEFHRNITSDPSYMGWNSSESSSLDMKTRLSISYTLLAGIGMAPADALTSDNGSLTRGSTNVPVGGIIGGVIGGIVLLVLLALGIILAIRRRRRNGKPRSIQPLPPADPFMLRISEKRVVNQSNAPSHWQVKDGGPGGVTRQVSRSVKSFIDDDYSEEERDHDSGWRPDPSSRRLPPTYAEAV
ncbi:hypothetical protein VNI00_015220 [Paramarasmius palmivorus]|uniref:Uncharacterized protein n=1 Tax=Paramarasmius palmivorus TaxID=297713 RepID=A0AAW0BLQ3_9AGAR